MELTLGTRGSALALAQAHYIKALLEKNKPGLTVNLLVVKTTGDRLSAEAPHAAPGGKGLFTKEVQDALLDGRAHLAVHSMKDLPTEVVPGLALAAVPPREDPRDCLISRFGEQLRELPRGSIVGTSSPRRRAQVLAAKKGVRVEDMRGNLDTRLKKLADGDVTSVVVAHAGVRRLGRADEVSEILEPSVMLPAPAQGCLAVETLAQGPARDLVAALDHLPSRRAALAERSFLSGLGGGCRVPIAAYAREENGAFVLDGLVITPDGARALRGRETGAPADAEALGAKLAARLLSEGAGRLLEASA
jgi:hydroxymethylbilane synthase